ncbi:hypothetical protein KEM56_005948 [Ascosphaera pollenicola]|nr:hypothetical protein KEM56_005948 [Ascosphaera pollenicola]
MASPLTAPVNATFPLPTAPKPNSFKTKGFKITTQKLPILKAGPIEEMTQKLGIPPPEMIFGDNHVSILHEPSGWGMTFNSFDALDRVDKTGERMLKVAHSSSWQKSRQNPSEDIKEYVKPFDWSYTTDYKGTVLSTERPFTPTDEQIPIELLKRPDPILLFDEIVIYEDELADNGISMLSVKIRVMPERLLLLMRFFMRLDNVLVRLRDTRVYIDFNTGRVIREYIEKEEKYEALAELIRWRGEDVPATMRDMNALAELLPVVNKTLESVSLQD